MVRQFKYFPNYNKHRHCRIYINNSYIKPDGFDPITNTIYEFYGDYFYGNPSACDLEKINHKNGKTFREIYENTLKREKLIKDAGYNLIYIWESDWKNISHEQKCTSKNTATSRQR